MSRPLSALLLLALAAAAFDWPLAMPGSVSELVGGQNVQLRASGSDVLHRGGHYADSGSVLRDQKDREIVESFYLRPVYYRQEVKNGLGNDVGYSLEDGRRWNSNNTGTPRRRSEDGLELSDRSGRATWYGPGFYGKLMANTKPYDPWAMTTASNDYPLGTILEVTYSKTITVEVTDRGAFTHLMDLSEGAFHALVGSNEPGVISVTVRQSK